MDEDGPRRGLLWVLGELAVGVLLTKPDIHLRVVRVVSVAEAFKADRDLYNVAARKSNGSKIYWYEAEIVWEAKQEDAPVGSTRKTVTH